MVRHYKKKKNKSTHQYTPGQLQLAIDCVKDGESVKGAAAKFGIPRTTLQKKCSPKPFPKSPEKKGFQRVFTDEQETALCEYIVDMESRLQGLSTKELRKLAYDFAKDLKIDHPFNRDTATAGKDWMMSFMHRHNLSNRKAQNTSAARANGFNKEAVENFFCLLKEIQDKHNIPANNIWNVDETSTSAVPKSSTRIIARKGRKQVGGKTSAERGENVTAEICMSATGVFMPPMLVFPRVKPNPTFLEGKPEGSWAVWDKSGYVNSDSFLKFLEKFIKFSKASKDNLQLLLLDGHYSHVKSLAVAKLAKESGVMILCFPPHCTHRMQPLDVGLMKPISVCYADEVKSFQRSGSLVQMKNIFSLYGKAWKKAGKVETAVNAFKATGIVPLNEHIFDHHFESPSRSSSFLESSINEERVEECKQILNNIVTSKQTQMQKVTSVTNSSTYDKSVKVPGTSQSSVEPEVKVPLRLIKNLVEATEPFISLLDNEQLLAPTIFQSNSIPGLLESTKNIFQSLEESNNENLSKKTSLVSKKRSRGTAAIVTDDAYIEQLEVAEKVKKIKKEPKAKVKLSQLKPEIVKIQAIPKGVRATDKPIVPVQVIQRQPLETFNYQYPLPGISLNLNQEGTVCTNASIINGAVVIHKKDGSYAPFYVNRNDNVML